MKTPKALMKKKQLLLGSELKTLEGIGDLTGRSSRDYPGGHGEQENLFYCL